jgi:hypothetical protein
VKFVEMILQVLLTLTLAAQRPNTADYVNQAREILKNVLRRSAPPADGLRTEVMAGPIFSPEHQQLHRQLNAPPGRAALSGRVLDAQWNAVAGATVSITEQGGNTEFASSIAIADGSFQIPNLVPGKYSVRVTSRTGTVSRSVPLDLAVGHRRVLLRDGGLSSIFAGSQSSAMILFASYQGNELVRLDLLRNLEHQNLSALQNDRDSMGMMQILTSTERNQTLTELAPFFATFYDVGRGSDRFERFLHPGVVCRIINSGEQSIPTIQPRRCLASVLDDLALQAWLSLESEDISSVADLQFTQPYRASDEERMVHSLRRREVLRNELRRAGMLDGEHAVRVQQYLQRTETTMPIMRVRLPENVPSEVDQFFPEFKGKTVYVVGSLNSMLCFTREGTELRLLGYVMVGG